MKEETILFEVVADNYRQHPGVEIQLPRRASKHSVGYDIYLPVDVYLEPFKPKLIFTDVKVKFPSDVMMLLNVRSSMGKIPVIISHGIGFIESDYYGNVGNDGNIGVSLLNLSDKPVSFAKGDRVAQVTFVKYLEASNGNTEEIRKGGLGSSNYPEPTNTQEPQK